MVCVNIAVDISHSLSTVVMVSESSNGVVNNAKTTPMLIMHMLTTTPSQRQMTSCRGCFSIVSQSSTVVMVLATPIHKPHPYTQPVVDAGSM